MTFAIISHTIKAVAIDLDGTLLDTIHDLAAGANGMRSRLGMALLPLDRIKSYVGDGMVSLVKRTLTDSRHDEPDADLLRQGLALFKTCYADVLSDSSQPFPQVIDGLHALHNMGLHLACITNKPLRFTEPLLVASGLKQHFQLVLGGDSLAEKKPHPLPLQHACEHFRIQPQQMVMIGDSANDVLAAKNAGCISFAVPYGYHSGSPLENLNADYVVSGLVEAAELIKNGLSR